MFVLATIKDTVKVAPSKFSGDALSVITAQIETKFADRVIPHVGLCICLHSYESIGDPYVYPSDGAAHYKVRFRLLVFRPFPGEILTGKVSSCTKLGIKVSLDFFENVSIPKDLLQSPSTFVRGEWVWSYPDPDGDGAGAVGNDSAGNGDGREFDGGDGGGEGDGSFTLALHDEVRFRVRGVNWTSVGTTPTGRLQATTVSTARGGEAGGEGGSAAGPGGNGHPRLRKPAMTVDPLSYDQADAKQEVDSLNAFNKCRILGQDCSGVFVTVGRVDRV